MITQFKNISIVVHDQLDMICLANEAAINAAIEAGADIDEFDVCPSINVRELVHDYVTPQYVDKNIRRPPSSSSAFVHDRKPESEFRGGLGGDDYVDEHKKFN